MNFRFMYCALKGLPWFVSRGYGRTSTDGEVYEISGDAHHTIEELSDLRLRRDAYRFRELQAP